MESGANLVKVVSCAHTPFHVVVSENIVAIGEFGWVAVSLVGLSTFAAVNVGRGVEVNVVLALAGSVAQVIKARSNVLSEAAGCKGNHGPLKNR